MRRLLLATLTCLCAAVPAVIAGGTAHAAATGPSPSCAASYQTTNEAQAQFVSQVIVTNTGSSAINGWSVTFTFGGHQVMTASWNATVQQSGAVLSAVNAWWDGTIPVGGGIVGFGLYGTWWGSDAPAREPHLRGELRLSLEVSFPVLAADRY